MCVFHYDAMINTVNKIEQIEQDNLTNIEKKMLRLVIFFGHRMNLGKTMTQICKADVGG